MKKTSLSCLDNTSYTDAETLTQSLLRQAANINEDLPLEIFIETVEQAPIAISITDKRANILYANQAFYKVTGYLPNEILGKNQSVLSDKNTPKEVYKDLWRTIAKKQIWHGQLVNRHQTGRPYLADLTIAPMLSKEGNITHYIGMQRDITANYEAEQQLKNQKQLIESVINLLPVAVAVIDSDDKVILDNHAYKALISDLSIKEPAHYFLDLIREEMGTSKWLQYQNEAQGFEQREYKVEISAKSSRWFSCAGAFFTENTTQANQFFKPESKQYLILTLTDISKQRRQVERLHLQSLKLLIAEDEQVRTIRETLLGAMHQIQLPMNQIKAAEHILQLKQDPQHQNLLNILQQIQQSGAEAVENMQACLPEISYSAEIPLNLNQILHESLLLTEQKIQGHDIEVIWQPESQLPAVLGSENKLHILFKQLLDNAIEAMEAAKVNDMELTLKTFKDGDFVQVCITDNGAGIPKDKQVKVFEPFYTTRNKGGKQAGTGLVMVKEIINQHQAFVEIDSSYEQGCRFKLSFPIYKTQTKEAKA